MRRRDLIAGIGGLLAAGTPGCLTGEEAAGNVGRPTNATRSRGSPLTGPAGSGPGSEGAVDWQPRGDDPFETVTVGSREGVRFPDANRPEVVQVWNGAAVPRSIGLALRRGGEEAFARTATFPAGGWLELTLNEPATYELVVAVGGEPAGTVEIERERFDCNDSWVRVAVRPGDTVDSQVWSTMADCGPAVYAGHSLSVEDRRCGTGGTAAVEFGERVVHVTGTVTAPTPCRDPFLSSVQAGDRGRPDDPGVGLVVGTTPDGRGAEDCPDCTGAVDYRLTVALTERIPAVRVVHDGAGGRRTVREVSR